jgi:hypothetical protein
MTDIEKLRQLLRESLTHLGDLRLHNPESAGRRRRETAQEHRDRISSQIQENEDRRRLIREIQEALSTEPKRSDCPVQCDDLSCGFPHCLGETPNVRAKLTARQRGSA